MATNQYVNKFFQTGQSSLHEDLVVESIKFNGVDVFYLPRTLNNRDDILIEDRISTFGLALPIEMYVQSVDGFEGQGDFLTKFGMQIEDQATFIVSRRSYNTFCTAVNAVAAGVKLKEGDIVFFPTNQTTGSLGNVAANVNVAGIALEIKFVEDEEPFYQFGTNHTWTLSTELFAYSGERFTTGYAGIDNIQYLNAYAIDLVLGTGSGDFTVGNTVTIGTITAKVAAWDSSANVVRVQDMTGAVNVAANVVDASTIWTISSGDSYEFPTDGNAQNDAFQEAANAVSNPVVDWSEDFPFGSY